MNKNFRIVTYVALLLNLLFVIVTAQNPTGIVFITAFIALITLILDVVIAVKRSIPLNAEINTWTPETYPAAWSEYRAKWLRVFAYRQLLNITGFIALVVGAVFS